MDGAIDYSSYSLQQLQEAEQSIDRERFPLNYVKLRAELSLRGVARCGPPALAVAQSSSEPIRPELKAPTALMWISMPLSIVVTIVDWRFLVSLQPTAVIIETQVIAIALFVWLIYKVSRGRNWSRIVLLVLLVFGLPFFLVAMIGAYQRSLVVGIILLIQLLLQVTAMYMFFTEPARNAFRKTSLP